MKLFKIAIALFFLTTPVLGLAACDTDDGALEETGEALDDAADEIDEEF
jgi:predicted small secreted protein